MPIVIQRSTSITFSTTLSTGRPVTLTKDEDGWVLRINGEAPNNYIMQTPDLLVIQKLLDDAIVYADNSED